MGMATRELCGWLREAGLDGDASLLPRLLEQGVDCDALFTWPVDDLEAAGVPARAARTLQGWAHAYEDRAKAEEARRNPRQTGGALGLASRWAAEEVRDKIPALLACCPHRCSPRVVLSACVQVREIPVLPGSLVTELHLRRPLLGLKARTELDAAREREQRKATRPHVNRGAAR